MAHKKGEGSTSNNRDSKSKRLGVKLFGSQAASAGSIIIRQRGTRYHAGENVYLGKDYTVHAAVDGTVAFRRGRRDRVYVSVIPFVEVPETVAEVKKPLAKAKPAPKVEKEEVVEMKVGKAVKVEELETPAAVEETKAAAPKKAAPAKKEAKAEAPKKEAAPKKPAPAAKEAKAESPKKEAAPKKAAKGAGQDDLKKVEGVGPKIASLLNEAGIVTFADLAGADVEKIKGVLEAAGSRYKMHDPTTWPQQAALAAEGKWDELQALQDSLKGGRAE